MDRKRTLAWLFVVSLLVRLFVVLIHTDVKLVHEMNGYDFAARSMLEGKGFVCVQQRWYRAFLPPGYSFFLAGIYALFGHSFLAARAVQALLGASSVLLLFFVAREIFDERVARLASWIMAFYPQSVLFADLMQTETLFLFLFLPAMLFFVRAIKQPGWRNVVLAGVFFGLAALTRSIIAFFPFAVAIFLALAGKGRGRVLRTVLVSLVMLAVISPWTIRNYRVLHTFVFINTKAGWDFFQHNHSGLYYIMRNLSDEPGEDRADRLATDERGHIDEVRLRNVCIKLALEWIKDHPLLFIFKGIRMQWNLFSLERTFFVNLRQGYYGHVPKWLLYISAPYIAVPFMLLLPLSIFGIIYCEKRDLVIQIVLLLFGYFMAIAFIAYLFYRQRYPLLPFLCCFASLAILKRKEIRADLQNLGDQLAVRRIIGAAWLVAFVVVGWAIDVGMSINTLLRTF